MGHFEAGEAINTVPSHGYLEGTIRTYDTEDLAIVKHQMHKIAKSVQLLFNVECEVKFEEGYPPTMNHPQLRQAVENAIKGANLEIVEKLPFLFGEDFSFMVNNLPLHILYLLVLKTMKKVL